jgi:predicted ribonuclease YlaK
MRHLGEFYQETRNNRLRSIFYLMTHIPFVSLIGRAGSGKTLMAIAAGMEQTLGMHGNKYQKTGSIQTSPTHGKRYWFLARRS